MQDPLGRPTIVDMVPTDKYPGLFPVGRLDMDTTGLLFFTTDGQMAQELLHPSKHVWKHYVAHVVGTPTEDQLNRLREGIELEDGPAAPAEVEIVSNDAKLKALLAPQGLGKTGGGEPNSLVSVTIREGRKHQVKKMLLAVHHRVLALHRDTFGPLHRAAPDPPRGERDRHRVPHGNEGPGRPGPTSRCRRRSRRQRGPHHEGHGEAGSGRPRRRRIEDRRRGREVPSRR